MKHLIFLIFIIALPANLYIFGLITKIETIIVGLFMIKILLFAIAVLIVFIFYNNDIKEVK